MLLLLLVFFWRQMLLLLLLLRVVGLLLLRVVGLLWVPGLLRVFGGFFIDGCGLLDALYSLLWGRRLGLLRVGHGCG